MSALSEGWGKATDLQKGLGLTAGLFVLGLAGQGGREGFEEGVIPGVGHAVGAGIWTILGIPVTFAKGLGEGLGLFKIGAEDVPSKEALEKLGIKGEDVAGLVSDFIPTDKAKDETGNKIAISMTIKIVLGVIATFLGGLLLYAIVRK